MGRYWIRNRGRVQGPFTVDRIQGLMRRGRFSRHFFVSEDKKEWLPASEFPELFDGVVPSRSSADDEVFQGGGSPFDDPGGAPPARTPARPRSNSPFDSDDDDEGEWEDDDDDWEEEWEEGAGGALTPLIDWVERNSRGLVLVLLLVVGGLGWFVFNRETFTQDKEDLDQLLQVKAQISSTYDSAPDPGRWTAFADEIEQGLAPMVDRLEETASAQDHVKQELLFAARDDIPKMMKELPYGRKAAEERLTQRFSRIDRMITKEVRIDSQNVMPARPQPQAAPQPVEEGADGQYTQPNNNESIPGRPQREGQQGQQPPTAQPTGGPGNNPQDVGDGQSANDESSSPQRSGNVIPGRPPQQN